MNQDDVAPGVGEKHACRPGHELGAARESAGISLKEMAATLHLPSEQVRALEDDDYSRLPPPAYVRGYLRTYAREVGMDADRLVADYDAVCGEVEDPALVIHPGVPDPVVGRGGPVLALLLVMAVAVVGALAWWLQQSTGIPIASNGDESTESAAMAETGSSQDDGLEEDAGDPEQAEPVEAEPTAPEAPEPATEEGGTDPAESTTTTTDTTEAIDDPAITDDTIDNTAAVDDPVEDSEVEQAGETPADEEPGDTAATSDTDEGVGERMLAEGTGPRETSRADEVGTVAAGEGPDELRIEVDGESWLEVFDARGRQLAYTLYTGDEPVTLNGWAPFDVMLGNSPVVTLHFGDLEIDHSAFVRSDSTARFLVDAEGASRR